MLVSPPLKAIVSVSPEGALHLVADRAVGHGALRSEVEAAMALAGAPHGFGKDVNLLGHQRAVGLRVGRDADKAAGLHVGEFRGDERRHAV